MGENELLPGGTELLLTTFLPFSPMTIDLVNLRRASQLAIHRHRRILCAGARLSWGAAVLWPLTSVGLCPRYVSR